MAETHETIDFGEPFYSSQCVLGEAPFYRPEDDTLHYVDPLANPPEIHILSLKDYNAQTSKARVLKLSDSISVAAFRKDHPNSYIGARLLGFAFIDEKTGHIENLKQMIADSDKGKIRFNDGAVDSRGRFWAGEMDFHGMSLSLSDPYVPRGRLWRYDPDGTTTQHENGIYCSNGLGWSPDNKYMYFSDSYGRIVWRYEFDEEKGTIENRVDFVDFRMEEDFAEGSKRSEAWKSGRVPEGLRGGEPDGMVVDTDGNLWMALWGKGCVVCFDSTGKLVREIRAEGTPYLTCTGWAGKDFDVLYCTSAYRSGLGGEKGGALFKIEAGKRWGVKGIEKFRFSG